MEQNGRVVDIKGDIAVVMVRRHDVCGKCGGCGAALAGSGENYVEAKNPLNAAVGHKVKISIDTAHVLKAAFVVYIVPVFALLLGIWAGQRLDDLYGIPVRLDIILGVLLLASSYLIVRGYDKKVGAGKVSASVVKIIDGSDDDAPADEKC